MNKLNISHDKLTNSIELNEMKEFLINHWAIYYENRCNILVIAHSIISAIRTINNQNIVKVCDIRAIIKCD